MDAVVYVNKPLKKINGSLFYCFEHFAFLKQHLPELKFIFVHDYSFQFPRKTSDEQDLEFFKSIFVEKYEFDHEWLNDVITMKPTQFMMANVENIMILDVHSYKLVKDYLGKTKRVLLYSNKPEGQRFLNKNPRDTLYGWYDDYQFYNIKSRLKVYKEIHKTFKNRGNKTFISSPNGNNLEIAQNLNLNLDELYLKEANTHYTDLFKNINKIIYWHCGNNDANNRILVESTIHNINIDIHVNGFVNDSVIDRKTLIEEGRINELYLSEDDLMIKEFLSICKKETT